MRRKLPITIASRSGWNRLVDRWFRHRLLEVRVIPPALWRYPFSCDLRWDAIAEQWSVGIVPGWCESPGGEASPTLSTLARLCPLAAQRLGEDDPEVRIVARLDESPRILVATSLWRAEGTDAVTVPDGGSRPLPEEIARRGVVGPVVAVQTESGIVQQVGGLIADRNNAALARAVEIFIEHGREVASLGVIAGAGAEIDFEVSFLPAAPETSRIGLRREWPAIEDGPEVPRWSSRGLSAVADEGIDRYRIATLWVTSPGGTEPGSEPDQTWRPYVEQRLSRNLAYEVSGPEIRAVPPLRLTIPGAAQLAGGVAAGLIRSLAGDLQSRADELDARLAGTETTGTFVPL
jgi:hypothetical protein